MERNMNSQLTPPLTPAERSLVQGKLLQLLSRQMEWYTAGESTSIRVEQAQELLDSICYCLGISATHPDGRWRRLLHCDIAQEYAEGLLRVEQKKQLGICMWQAACANLPPVWSTAMLDTLKSLGSFWKKYDSGLFAHWLPGGLDYQLAIPVSDTIQGVDYAIRYLEHLFSENRFLSAYQPDTLIPILNQYCPDYKGLVVNLFEPAAANALGLAVLGRLDGTLQLGRQELERLSGIWEHMGRAEIRYCLLQGLEGLRLRHALDPEVCAYLAQYSGQLAVRVDMLRDKGGLHGIFQAV